MIRTIRERLRQGRRTIAFPYGPPPELPDRFRGLPVLDASKCREDCLACAEVCPTDAVGRDRIGLRLDLGRCLFCAECVAACPENVIDFTPDFRLAVRSREDLIRRPDGVFPLAKPLETRIRRLFGRSLKLRQVCAGGDNSAESEINVLSTVVFDLERFGIQIVASPRHADGLIVTGPVTNNMKTALITTYESIAHPKIVIAVGACAISGGIFRGCPEVNDGVDGILPVDLYVPGNPPHPLAILDGLLRLIGRLENQAASTRERILRNENRGS